MQTLLVIDNYDSFTHNLVQMFMGYRLDIRVFRNDGITIAQALEINPSYLLISPGPKDPENAGMSMPLIRCFTGNTPILGVCLGMQCINEVMGGETVPAPVPVHGKKSRILHNRSGIFRGLPSPFTAARYHSLMVKPLGGELEIHAWTSDHIIMGLSHPRYPVFGVQFHPESFMTEYGQGLARNFLSYGAETPEYAYSAA
ncbi:MAG: aminodeoxychorismate/anthranilate synthase component II [Desulfobacterales bacterium]|nr:aminodeoxychorismate/anthranilate synthase component II [Desulfobacterales bacterium]